MFVFLNNVDAESTDALIYSPENVAIALNVDIKDEEEESLQVAPINLRGICYRQDSQFVMAFLKMHSLVRATNAVDVTVVDRIEFDLRFNVIYHVQSVLLNLRYEIIT
jgi:hypothetical protein